VLISFVVNFNSEITDKRTRLSAVARLAGPARQHAAAAWPPYATPTARFKTLSGRCRARTAPCPTAALHAAPLTDRAPRHARPLADRRLAPRAAVPTEPPRPDRLAHAARLPTAAVRSRALAAAATAPARHPSPSRRAGEPSSPPSPVRRRRVIVGSLSSAAAPPCAAPRTVRLGRERFRPSAPD
jgi:hypothetical protein